MSRVRENLSSDSLFHFIKKREWLKRILKEKSFQARYVYEDIFFTKIKMGVPMKCFCDIPLGKIKRHVSKYRKFGIGITKDFARKNKITPILYVHNNSGTILRYLSAISDDSNLKSDNYLFPYFKMEEKVTQSKNGNKIINRFYDEREWRFIPDDACFKYFIIKDNYETINSNLQIENDRIDKDRNKYKLNFTYSDISYIFVQNESDVELIILEIKSLNIGLRDTELLISKIVTADQICNDF